MAGQASFAKAKSAKNDEFYTRLSDIELELSHYESAFAGKSVLCNCDDPSSSKFWEYFHKNFTKLGIRKLVAVHYTPDSISYQMIYCGGKDENIKSGIRVDLKGDGDFRSEECVAIMDDADIVVTNPPFSLFVEYVELLYSHDKDFIIVGNQANACYKSIFELFRQNKIAIGYNKIRSFEQPDGTVKKFGNICWFTNLNVSKADITLSLVKAYDPDAYPKYDNYDAINIDKVADIPCDYYDVMGVPITYLEKHDPTRFEIIGRAENADLYKLKTKVYTYKECADQYFKLFGKKGSYDMNSSGVVNGVKKYERMFIRRK